LDSLAWADQLGIKLIEVVYREGIVFVVLAEYVRYVGVRVRGIKGVGRGRKGRQGTMATRGGAVHGDRERKGRMKRNEVWRGAVHVHRSQAERDEPGMRGGREQGSEWREGWKGEERAPRTAHALRCRARGAELDTVPHSVRADRGAHKQGSAPVGRK
jgi:hypothetical protein